MKLNTRNFLFMLFLPVVLLLTSACQQEKEYQWSGFMLNTLVRVKVLKPNDLLLENDLKNTLRDVEKKFNVHDPDSELSYINANASVRPVAFSEKMGYLFQKAMYYYELSEGAFNIAAGPLIRLWNVNGEEVKRDKIPAEDEIEKAIERSDFENVQIFENSIFFSEEGMSLDLGGIAKGYAADELLQLFEEKGVTSGLIDLGGNIVVFGNKRDGMPWKVGIQDPEKKNGEYLAVVEIEKGSIVTSGNYERFFEYEGKRFHHIIDTKKGYPAENDLNSVTIVSEKSVDGDALSTACFVLGLKKGKDLVDRLDDVEAIFIPKEGSPVVTDGLKGRITYK